MYVKDGNSKRRLNEEERSAFIKKNKSITFFAGHGLCDMEEITINDNKIDLDGIYLEGTYIFYTRNFTANRNNISVKSFLKHSRTDKGAPTYHIFEVSPYKYGYNQGSLQKNNNASLETNVEVKDNTLSISDQEIYRKDSLETIPLIYISQQTTAAYLDADGVSQPIPFKYGEVVYSGNKSTNGPKPVKCIGSYSSCTEE